VSFGRVALTATSALGIGHSIGLAALSSGAVRYRMYSRGGLDLVAVGRLIVFSGFTVAISLCTVGAASILWQGEELARLVGVTPQMLTAVAIVALCLVAAYFAGCLWQPRALHIRKVRLHLPSFGLACGQLVVGSGHLLSVSAVLYASLRSFVDTDFPTVAALYVGADMSALVGHVPGGWGVLEYIVTNALDGPHVLAGLIIFRASYYLLPLTIGVAIFILDEVTGRRMSRRMAPSAGAVTRH
jgi:glycosyltransferase 2 family protein